MMLLLLNSGALTWNKWRWIETHIKCIIVYRTCVEVLLFVAYIQYLFEYAFLFLTVKSIKKKQKSWFVVNKKKSDGSVKFEIQENHLTIWESDGNALSRLIFENVARMR